MTQPPTLAAPATRLARAAACVLALAAAACAKPAPGTVVGDAFLAEQMGEEVNLGGLRVRLVREQGNVDSLLMFTCPTKMGAASLADTVARARSWQARARLLAPMVRRTVSADARARFVLDTVPPGRYRLWADTVVGGTRWTWLQRVTVKSGDTIRANLTNDNPDENPFRCKHGV